MLLAEKENIRKYNVSNESECSRSDDVSPIKVDDKQLKELNIKIDLKELIFCFKIYSYVC